MGSVINAAPNQITAWRRWERGGGSGQRRMPSCLSQLSFHLQNFWPQKVKFSGIRGSFYPFHRLPLPPSLDSLLQMGAVFRVPAE